MAVALKVEMLSAVAVMWVQSKVRRGLSKKRFYGMRFWHGAQHQWRCIQKLLASVLLKLENNGQLKQLKAGRTVKHRLIKDMAR
jgi:hypothetical protein